MLTCWMIVYMRSLETVAKVPSSTRSNVPTPRGWCWVSSSNQKWAHHIGFLNLLADASPVRLYALVLPLGEYQSLTGESAGVHERYFGGPPLSSTPVDHPIVVIWASLVNESNHSIGRSIRPGTSDDLSDQSWSGLKMGPWGSKVPPGRASREPRADRYTVLQSWRDSVVLFTSVNFPFVGLEGSLQPTECMSHIKPAAGMHIPEWIQTLPNYPSSHLGRALDTRSVARGAVRTKDIPGLGMHFVHCWGRDRGIAR